MRVISDYSKEKGLQWKIALKLILEHWIGPQKMEEAVRGTLDWATIYENGWNEKGIEAGKLFQPTQVFVIYLQY